MTPAACTAYTRYVLDIGQSEDWLALQMAIAPCLLGYGAVAQMLAAHPATVREQQANTYWPWIETYGAADYVEAVRLGSGTFPPPPPPPNITHFLYGIAPGTPMARAV